MRSAPILLLHGACHGAWCWDRVTPLLHSVGRRVVAPDLPGRGRSRGLGWKWSLKDYSEAVIEAARQAGGPVIAVGHSMGGMIQSAAAEAAPELFERLVYASAFLPADGDSLASLAAMDTYSDLAGATTVAWLKGCVTIKSDRLAPVYYDPCPPAELEKVRPRIVPEPLRPSLTRVRLGDRFAAVPRSYIRCTRDRALSLRMQDRMIGRQPCERIATLDASHSPFVTMPDSFAAALLSVI